MRYLLKCLTVIVLLATPLFGQSLNDPNVTATAKGQCVVIPLRYADAPALAMLFANSQCQGMPLRYQMLMMMSGGFGNQGGMGGGNQNRYGGGMGGWGNQGGGMGYGGGMGGFGNQGGYGGGPRGYQGGFGRNRRN